MKQIRDTLEEVGFALEHATSELSRFVLTDYLEPYKAASVKLDILIAHLSAVPANNPWQQAIDDELVNTHLGIAQDGVTREEAKAQLNNLIAWHIDVAKYFDAQAQQAQETVKAIAIGFDYLDNGQLVATYAVPVRDKFHPKLYTAPPAQEPVKPASWISVEEAKTKLKDGDLLYVTFQNGDVAKAVYRWEQGYYPHRIECEKYGNERLEICTHIMHRKPVPLPLPPVSRSDEQPVKEVTE